MPSSRYAMLAIVILIAATTWYGIHATTEKTSSLLACTEDTAPLTCVREEIRSLLATHSGADIMSMIDVHTSDAMCHNVGHIVGQEIFLKHRSIEAAIENCSYQCFSACIHGIIGTALIEETGVTVEEGVAHFNAEDLKKHGKRLCANENTCHGVGHLLFQLHQDVDDAAETCDSLSEKRSIREYCYRGVFMEHADSLSTHNTLLGTSRTRDLRDNDMLYPCTEVSAAYRHACFRYQHLIQRDVLNAQGITDMDARIQKQKIACETLTGKDRSSCFEGFGLNRYKRTPDDPHQVRAVCESLGMPGDRAACLFGAVYSLAVYFHDQEALAFCAEVDKSYERSICYHGAFELMAFFNVSTKRMSRAEAYTAMHAECEMTDFESQCINELGQFRDDPWDTSSGLVF